MAALYFESPLKVGTLLLTPAPEAFIAVSLLQYKSVERILHLQG